MPSDYQIKKAKQILNLLLDCNQVTAMSRNQLARAISIMNADQWRTVAFTAGVPVADLPAKGVVIQLLRERAIHQVGR